MSQPNRSLERNLARAYRIPNGLYGIKGLSFAYRLNTWGPKEGPAMVPANTFADGTIPPPVLSGLSSFFTSIESFFGIASPADIVTDAHEDMNAAVSRMTGTLTSIHTLTAQAQAYDHSSDQGVLGKAQAAEAEAAGLVATYQALQSAAAGITTQLQTSVADPATTKEMAAALRAQVNTFSDQVSNFLAGIGQLQKNINELKSAAHEGPGVTGFVENVVSSSASKLTWIVGGGLMIYFLGPTFIPRLASGLRKARS